MEVVLNIWRGYQPNKIFKLKDQVLKWLNLKGGKTNCSSLATHMEKNNWKMLKYL